MCANHDFQFGCPWHAALKFRDESRCPKPPFPPYGEEMRTGNREGSRIRVSGVLSTNREELTAEADVDTGFDLAKAPSGIRYNASTGTEPQCNPSLEPTTRHGKRRDSQHLRSQQTRNNTKNNTNKNDNRCVNNNHDSVTQVITRGCAQRRGSAVHIPEPGLERYTSPRTRARGVTGVG